jgi:hypothetical protein
MLFYPKDTYAPEQVALISMSFLFEENTNHQFDDHKEYLLKREKSDHYTEAEGIFYLQREWDEDRKYILFDSVEEGLRFGDAIWAAAKADGREKISDLPEKAKACFK